MRDIIAYSDADGSDPIDRNFSEAQVREGSCVVASVSSRGRMALEQEGPSGLR